MELISAKLHTSIGSFPSSSSLTGFLTSDEGVSPIKTYPIYVTKNTNDTEHKSSQVNNTLIILNEQYKPMHKIALSDKEIIHISCHKSKIAIATKSDVRIVQKFGSELRTLCILDEENVYNSCFFLDGNGLCVAKKPNKITLYNIADITNRYHAQLDAIEKEKEKLKKRKKIRKGLDSSATTPTHSVIGSAFSFESQTNNIDEDSEIDDELIGDIINDMEQTDINALMLRYRTLYIETQKPDSGDSDKEWNIRQLRMCCTSSFWWIGIIDNFGVLHVGKLIAEWPSVSNLSDIISNTNTRVIQLWREQSSISVSRTNTTKNGWFIGMWTWFTDNAQTQCIDWYELCDKMVLIVLDSRGVIHLWNEPSYNYILSALNNYESDQFIFRCILSIDSAHFIGFQCIRNALCNSVEFEGNINNNHNDYIWLLTLDKTGNICVYFIQNIVLFECGKASLISFAEIDKGIIYRLGHVSKSLSFAYLFDTQRGVTITDKYDSNGHQIASPIMTQWYLFFDSGIFCHFSIDINNRHVICNRMFGGILPNDPIITFTAHPSLRYNIFAVLSQSHRLSVFDYSQNLDSEHCNNAPSLIYVVPLSPILAFAWDQTYRRLICVSQRGNEYILSVHVYKSKNGWFAVWEKPIRLNPKQKILHMIIAPYTGTEIHTNNVHSPFHHRKQSVQKPKSRKNARKSKQPKSNLVIVAQQTAWSGFMIELDKLARPYESRSDNKNKKDSKNKSVSDEKKTDDSDSFSYDNNRNNNPQILIHRRPYGELKAHRDRIKRRPPSEAPNSLYKWKKSDRRPAPLVVRSVKVDKELYGKNNSFTTEMLAAIIGESYGGNKRLIHCNGVTTTDRAMLVCIFETEKKTQCACITISDNSQYVMQEIVIQNQKIINSDAKLLTAKCINSSRILLIHESEGIMLYERQSSSLNEWKFEVLIPHKENKIKMCSMMKTAGGPCIATANQDLGSVQLLFPVLSDLSTQWNHDTYFRKFKLQDLIMAMLGDEKDIYVIQKKWPDKAIISSLIFLSPTILLVYRTDIEQWIIVRISTASVAGWPGRPLYHPIALYQDMKCTNFKRIHRILRDFLKVLRRVPEQSYGSGDVRSRFLVPIKWLLDKDENTDASAISHLQFDASADYYLKPAEVREVHDLLQKIKLPMVSTTHTLTLLALTDTLVMVQEQQRNLDVPGAQFMFASNLFKLKRKTSVPLGCIAWAMHSDSQDALHDLCIPKQNDKISYEAYKSLGIAYWLRNKGKLTKLMDKLSMAIFRKTKNPIDAMLWYILLNKKQILVSLLKITKGKEKIHRFMTRDFTVLRNQNAARQNAVSLTSKHKFLEACAFWLLAGEEEPAINVALQNLDDPHLALLITRLLYQDKDDTKYDQVLENKILPAVSNRFHNNAWEQHMILWLLRRPKEAVNVFLPTKENPVCTMSDAPEIYAFVSYLNDNEIVKSVRAREENMGTSGNAAAAIFSSPIFDMFDMGDFDYASGTFKSADTTETKEESKETEIHKPFEPKAYDLASKVITDTDLIDLLRRAAVSYSRCGMLIHALESVEQVMKKMAEKEESKDAMHSLQQLQSTLLWRFLCVRSTVMEQSHHIEPEQTKDDFADLSARFPKFDALLTLNYLYGECHLRGYMINSCNIPSGPTLTRLLIVLSRNISSLMNIISHRSENRFETLQQIDMLAFIGKWESVIDDLGLLGKERRIAIAAIAGIIHCGIFLKMFGLNRYDILQHQICKSNLSATLQQIMTWYNEESINDEEFTDDEYKDNLKYLGQNINEDPLWTNHCMAHGPIELLVVKTFRFTIFERFVFLWRKLLKKIGLHASHFIDLGTLYTQFSSWLLDFGGDLQKTYQMVIVYCQETKIQNVEHTCEPLTKYNMFDSDERTNDIYHKLEMNKTMQYLSEKIRLFRSEHEEKKTEEKRDSYGYAAPQQNALEKKISYNNDNLWYEPYDVFKIDSDLPATISYNKCAEEWITIATNNGLREINMDCSLRFRTRNEENRAQLMDTEFDNYTDCLHRFKDIETPKHTEIFGYSPFGGIGDKRHCKPYSISASVGMNKINENAKPYPINPLLPRIQLQRLPNFLSDDAMNRHSPKLSKTQRNNSNVPSSPNILALNDSQTMLDISAKNKESLPGQASLNLERKPSEIYFQTFDSQKKMKTLKNRSSAFKMNEGKTEPLYDKQYTIDKSEYKQPTPSVSAALRKNEPQPAVTNSLQCNLLYGFSSYKLDIPLFYHCLDVPQIAEKRRALSNTYKFYARVISQQNKAINNSYGQQRAEERNSKKAEKELQVSDKDIHARNETYLIIAAHPSLPLYISSNTKADGMRLWHYHHSYPLASFSLPLSHSSKGHKSGMSSPTKKQTQPKGTKSAKGKGMTSSRSVRNLKTSQKSSNPSAETSPPQNTFQKRQSSQGNNYMSALKFNGFGNKVCGISQNGNLYLWHFNVPRSIFRREFRAYYTQECHDKFGNDLVFIRGSSCIGTAGESANNHNVCVWDLLFKERNRALIRSYPCYEGNGANCIEYASDIDAIIVGGHKGVLHMFDKRIPFPILKWEHGQSRIWKLSYSQSTHELLVGTLEGLISVWDVRKLYNKSTLYSTNKLAAMHSCDDSSQTWMKFNDLSVPAMTGSGPQPFTLSKSANAPMNGGGGGTDNGKAMVGLTMTGSYDEKEYVRNGNGNSKESDNGGGTGMNRNNPTSLSYASLNNSTTLNYVKPINCDQIAIVNEWKLFQRRTFLNHTFGAASQLGYVASVGLTQSIWTNNGNILCTGSDGTVKYLQRKTKLNL